MKKHDQTEGKIAIVTGASDGAGADIAAPSEPKGPQLWSPMRKDAEAASRVVADIIAAVAGRWPFMATLRTRKTSNASSGLRRCVRQAAHRREQCGHHSWAGASETDKPDRFDVNVFGTFLMCQQAARQFDQWRRLIINMSSVGSRDLAPDRVAYSTTKGVVETLTLGLSHEFGSRGIRVISIDPS